MSKFKKAEAQQAFLEIALFGHAGAGKTFTSLLIAEELAKSAKKRIAFIDTERGSDFYCKTISSRKIHSDAFDFDVLHTKSITESLEAVRTIDINTYSVIIVDSITAIWESAQNAFVGRKTNAGTIPLHAWAQIKRPYKNFIDILMSLQMHVILCSRQSNDFSENENGELKNAGYKMKCESETAYEMHTILRLEANKDTYIAHVEKDRTGVLAKIIEKPSYETIAKSLLAVLSDKQAVIQSADEVAAHDFEKLNEQDNERQNKSVALRQKFEIKLRLATTLDEIDAISKEIIAEKSNLMSADILILKQTLLTTKNKIRERK